MHKNVSLDLVDQRIKVTLEAKCALRAHSRIEDKDESEIARIVLHEWAMKEIKKAKVMDAFMKSEGISRVDEGR